MKSYLSFMKQLDLPDEKKELICWKNAAKLFKIDVSKFDKNSKRAHKSEPAVAK